jgi:diacylglycerol kinase (ATP)
MNRPQASEINEGRLAILLNPSAGQGRAGHRREKLEGLLRENRLSFDLYITENEEQLKAFSRKLAIAGRTIVGAGGDSTFHLIINEIMSVGGKAPFGLLGLGSSNDITREFGLEPLERAVAALKLGRTKTVDLGCLKQASKTLRYFLGQANIGLGVAVNKYVDSLARRRPWLARRQTLAGTLGIIKAYRERMVPIHLTVKSEKDILEGDFISVIFSNVRYWATGKLIAPQARPHDGRLDACLIGKCSFPRLARINGMANKGRHGRAPEVRLLQSAEFTVSSAAPFDIQADGEILSPDSASPLCIRAKPGALRIIH